MVTLSKQPPKKSHHWRFQRDMSIAHADFLRLLPIALRRAAPHHRIDFSRQPREQDDGIEIRVADGWLQIALGPQQSRILASLTLPCTTVIFNFYGVPQNQAQTMMAQIDAAYRRGGG